ncbi:sulfatase family protein [Anatilimnocola floriformis]|uniref:sulfatase family protein n=1 Tax=Anatilimnocola floriformis TaxID=2948575 RepID=UPI0020C2D690|nr:sulfatase [Anatilimnocola floriformis]
MKVFALVLAIITLITSSSVRAADSTTGAKQLPNIVLLLSDDHSYPYLSTYGSPNVKTPVLDKLAAEGMKFHRFFTGAPQCVPSRATLMTGRSPVAARMTRFSSPLPRDEVTLPELLREKGNYYTGVCGRNFHLDGAARAGAAISEVFKDHNLQTFKDRVDYLNTGSDVQVSGQVEEFLAKRPAGKPFFLWASFSDPHHVWNAPAEFRPDPKTLVLPAHWPDLPALREQLADYFAEINRLDQTIAGVLATLKKSGGLENTILVFCGDNGAALPHGKGSLYDPGSNVPFFIHWPSVIKAGGDSRTLLSGEDLAPTLLAAAGIEPGNKMSGRSFLPLLKGEKYQAREHVFVERGPHGSAPVTVNMTNAGYDLGRAVRSDRYKFIYNCTPWIPYSPVDSAGGAGWKAIQEANAADQLAAGLRATYFTTPRPVYELYDLNADPSELSNLSGKPEVAEVERDLRSALAKKMILDFDYLPLPALLGDDGLPANNKKKGGGKKQGK